jgi:hypothetical protein
MAIVQHGPPEWVWERTPDHLRWELKEMPPRDGEKTLYELKMQCGLKILRIHFFSSEEMWQLVDTLSAGLQRRVPSADGKAKTKV